MSTARQALTERAFVDGVGRLTQPELTAFVVALWEARGFSTRVRDGDVLAERGGRTVGLSVVSRGRRRRRRGLLRGTVADLLGRAGDEPRRRGIDRVVLGERLDGRHPYVIDATSLYDIVTYGVDREVARGLVAEHLGLPFDSVSTDPSTTASTRRRRDVLTAAGTLLGMSALFWRAIVSRGYRFQTGADDATGATAGRSGAEAVVLEPTVVEDTEPLEPHLAPGVTTAGLVDIYELARTHARLVSETSYQWDISYAELVGERVVIYGTETVRVERPGVFVTTVDHGEILPPRPSPVDVSPTYADGTTRYIRLEVDSETLVRREAVRRDGDRMATRARTYVDRYLFAYPSQYPSETDAASAGTTSSGHRLYRVTVTALKPDELPDRVTPRTYHVEALVDERGFVHGIQSRDERQDRIVTVEFVYTNIGSTTVEPPEWAEAAPA